MHKTRFFSGRGKVYLDIGLYLYSPYHIAFPSAFCSLSQRLRSRERCPRPPARALPLTRQGSRPLHPTLASSLVMRCAMLFYICEPPTCYLCYLAFYIYLTSQPAKRLVIFSAQRSFIFQPSVFIFQSSVIYKNLPGAFGRKTSGING